jgi:hypothetical protein
MVWERLAQPRVHLALVLASCAILGVLVQVQCVDLLTTDGVCFLRMVDYYAAGDFRHAVFGSWSPLGIWLAVPLRACGLGARVAFRVMIALWAGLAVGGAWRLGKRLGLGPRMLVASTACAALMIVEFSAGHRVDLLVAALLLWYLDAVMDPRLLTSRHRAAAVGALGAAAYLAKFYGLPFFVAHFTVAVLVHGWAASEPGRLRRMAASWSIGLATCALLAAPWVAVLSAKYGRLTFGTAVTADSLAAHVRGEAPKDALVGLRRPPADAWCVWHDATLDRTGPPSVPPAPLGRRLSDLVALGWRNRAVVLGHLASIDEFRLALATLVLLPLAAWLTRRRRGAAAQYLLLFAAVGIYCVGYAMSYPFDRRYYWFVFLALTVTTFHIGEAVAAWFPERKQRSILAAIGTVLVISFAFHPVRMVRELLRRPPMGRCYRELAERMDEWGVRGTVASVGRNGWRSGMHVTYCLRAQYAGSAEAQDAAGIVREMHGAGAGTLLVWDRPRLLAALTTMPDVRLLGVASAANLPGLPADVAVLEVGGGGVSESPREPAGASPIRPD